MLWKPVSKKGHDNPHFLSFIWYLGWSVWPLEYSRRDACNFWDGVIKDTVPSIMVLLSCFFSLGSFALGKPAAMSWEYSGSLWRGIKPPVEQSMIAGACRRPESELGNGRSGLQMTAACLVYSLQPHGRPWAGTTRLSHFQLPDTWELCGIINVCCFLNC